MTALVDVRAFDERAGSGCKGSFPDIHERPLLPLLAVNIWVYVAGARLAGALD